jgi:aryl-alcohol dehydrogenase
VPLEILSPMGCGIQTGAGGVINTLKAGPGESLVIFGAGSVGLSAIMAGVISGCAPIIAVDIMPERLDLAKKFGATHVINGKEADAVAEIKKLTGSGAKYTMECTGIPQVLRQAVDSLMMGGTCALLGVAPVGVEAHLEMQTLLDGRTVKGCVEGDSLSDIFIPQLIEFYRAGRLPFDKLVTFYTLDQINEAVKDTHDGKALKAILKM